MIADTDTSSEAAHAQAESVTGSFDGHADLPGQHLRHNAPYCFPAPPAQQLHVLY